jgi:hypothetical protein
MELWPLLGKGLMVFRRGRRLKKVDVTDYNKVYCPMLCDDDERPSIKTQLAACCFKLFFSR